VNKPLKPGDLVQQSELAYRFCFLIDAGGNALATQIEIPRGHVLMVVSNYRPPSILLAESYKDWGVFLAGDQLVVAQWKYFRRVKK